MGYVSFRDQLAVLIEAVDGIGKVHKVIHNPVFWEDYFSRAKKDGRINVWEITRIGMSEDLDTVQNAVGVEPCFQDLNQFVIIGRMSHQDADKDEDSSEETFQVLIDAIVTKIRQNNRLDTLSGDSILLPRQAQVLTIEHRTYGGVLCHYCEITYEAIERVGG